MHTKKRKINGLKVPQIYKKKSMKQSVRNIRKKRNNFTENEVVFKYSFHDIPIV